MTTRSERRPAPRSTPRSTPRRAPWPAPFEADRRAIDRYLSRRLARLPGVPARLARALRAAALAPGKRVRPLLVLLGYDAVGGPARTRRAVFPAAAALEFVHAFSLVHDDLPALDDDDLRRGRPTLHKAFDEATAILAGDALLALAFEELATTTLVVGDPRRVALAAFELAAATGASGMVGGQVLDLAAEGRWGRAAARHGATRARVTAIHRGKTARLVAAALVVGGCLGGGSAKDLAALEAVGLDLGLAFQVADDLLNETGDARTLGKNAGTDKARGKATFPRAVGTARAVAEVRRLTARAIRRAKVFPLAHDRFVTLATTLAARRA